MSAPATVAASAADISIIDKLGPVFPNPTEFFPMLIAFGVLAFLMAKFVWPMVTKALDERQDAIAGTIAKAEETRIDAERLLEEYKVQMAEARGDAAKVIEEGRAAAEAIRADLVAKAEAEAEAMLGKARDAIDAEKRAAMAELQSSVADISVAVAGKLIGEKLSPEQDAALIDRFVAEVGGLNEN